MITKESNALSPQPDSAFCNYPDVLDIGQMSEILGICTKTGYRLLQTGEIVSRKVGRSYRIPKVHVLSYLRIGVPA